MSNTRYVVGFMFSADLELVALIRKRRPTWQAGKLNGVGGKIEADETDVAAMVREFREETGYANDYERLRRELERVVEENERLKRQLEEQAVRLHLQSQPCFVPHAPVREV